MLLSSLDAILFDAGGTLVHLDYAFIEDAARNQGHSLDSSSLPEAEAKARHAIDARSQGRAKPEGDDQSRLHPYFEDVLAAAGLPMDAVRDLTILLLAEHCRSNLWRVPFPDAASTLSELRRRGQRTAVISNADGRAADTLTRLGLVAYLEFVVDSHFEGVEKPGPEIFHRALARLGVPGERVAYVGDIYSIDVVGARAAGLYPVLIDPTGSYADLDCPSIGCLKDLLDPKRRAR